MRPEKEKQATFDLLAKTLAKWGGREDRLRDKAVRIGFEAGQEYANSQTLQLIIITVSSSSV